jgi:hypothetical protein
LLLLKVAIGGAERSRDKGFVGMVEMDEGHAHASPAALEGREGMRLVGDKGLLLLKCEFKDATAFLLRRESGEDAVIETEVGVTHV